MAEGRILLVEDDGSYRYSLTRTLEHAGYEVTAYEDYQGALKLLEGPETIDLLLTDIRLPPRSPHGISLAHMARTRRPNLPMLFVTAFAEYADEVPAELGGTLIKPVETDQLLSAVADAIGRRKSGTQG
jgi:CheY-like chemotaxis protein